MSTLTFRTTQKGIPLSLRLRPDNAGEQRRAEHISGARPQDDGTVTYALNPTTVEMLHDAFPFLDIDIAVQQWYFEYTQQVDLLTQLRATADIPPRFPREEKLRPYQRVGAAWLSHGKRMMLADKMGLGKSPMSLLAAQQVEAKRILIVTLAMVKTQWKHEVQAWLGREAVVAEGTVEERRAILASKPDILIVNYDMFADCYPIPKKEARQRKDGTWTKERPEKPAYYIELLKQRWDVVIFDEAHKLQNHDHDKSLTAKAGAAIARNAPYIFELTGTPFWNMPSSVWHLLHLLDTQRFSAYWPFVERYCTLEETQWGIKIIGVREDTKDEFQRILSEYILQRTKEEVLPQLPPKMYDTHYYDLTREQWGIYKTIKETLVLPRDDGSDSYIANAAAALAPLRRLCNAPVLLDYDIPSPKDAVLLHLLEDIFVEEKKVVILTWHQDYAEYLTRLLRSKKYSVSKATDATKKRLELIETFKQDSTQVLIGTLGGMGTGINLDNIVHHAIFVEMDWTPLTNEQAEDRFHRFTTTSPVTIHRLIASATIEEHVYDVYQHKSDIANDLMAMREIVRKVKNS